MRKGLLQLFYLLFPFLPFILSGQIYQPIIVGDESELSVANHIYLFTTPKYLTPNEAFEYQRKVKIEALPTAHLQRGYEADYCWAYFRLKNKGNIKNLILTFNLYDVHHFECFKKTSQTIDTLALTGDARPFKSRPIAINYYAVPISLQPNEEIEIALLIEKRFELIGGDFGLYESDQFYRKARVDFGIFMGYLGIMFFLLLFNLFLWFSLKDNIHLIFIAQLMSGMLFLVSSSGYLREWFLPNLLFRSSTIGVAMAEFWLASNFFLIRSLLNMTKKNSRFSTLCLVIGFINLVAAILLLLTASVIKYPLQPKLIENVLASFEIVYAINLFVIICVFTEQLRKGNKMAKLYLLALSLSLFGFGLSFLARKGLIPSGFNLGWVMPGVLFEQIVLAFGLTIRYNQFKEKNILLQYAILEERQTVVAKTIQVQEIERKRLAQDLHDDLGGTLSVIKGKVANKANYPAILNLVEKAILDLRNISRNFSPPDLNKLGLKDSIRQLTSRLQTASHIKFTYIGFGNEVKLPEEHELNIYRIVSELLNNIIKHSKASAATIQVIYHENYLNITVDDNGIGMANVKNTEGIGLKNITSRVKFLKAEMTSDSSSKGTIFVINIPF